MRLRPVSGKGQLGRRPEDAAMLNVAPVELFHRQGNLVSRKDTDQLIDPGVLFQQFFLFPAPPNSRQQQTRPILPCFFNRNISLIVS